MVVSVQGVIVLNMTISSFTAEALHLTTLVYEVWNPGGFGGAVWEGQTKLCARLSHLS